jgi:hypothetical protein
MTGRRPWAAMGAVAVVGALGLMTAGCGGDSPSSTTSTSVVVTSSTVPATTVATAPSSTATTSPTTSPARPTVVDDVLRGGSEADGYTYEQTFPRLQGLADMPVQDAINAQILTEVTAIVDEFVAGTEGAVDPADLQSGLRGGYEVSRIDDDLLSTRVFASPYFAGAAHPGSVQATFNFDLRTGKRLTLADLFTPGSPYLATLSEQSRQLLAAQPGIGDLPEFVTPGTEPTEANFAHWTLSDQDLVITFDQYQVAPGAAGTPHVSIPFASLRTILDPTGPLAIHN